MTREEISRRHDEALEGKPAYDDLLAAVREHIKNAGFRVALAANKEMVALYYSIGKEMVARQDVKDWGTKGEVIDQLASDLRHDFPDMTGLSRSNLYRMRRFASEWPEESIVPRSVGQLPWRHNMALLVKLGNQDERLWYAHKALEHGWSSDVLVHQIESDLKGRTGTTTHNFDLALPPDIGSELAQEIFKDTYDLEFLRLAAGASEKDLQRAIEDGMTQFMMELGGRYDFCFVGRQVHLEVEGQDFYVDLMFYNRRHRFLLVSDLKIREFRAEDAGKMNLYLNVVDDRFRNPGDLPSIGLILCKERNKTVVRYALQGQTTPMDVASYRLLPEDVRKELPSIDEIQAGLDDIIESEAERHGERKALPPHDEGSIAENDGQDDV
jgi:predicted nuclease of restriction endonuclease-like (RecB) superfamily